MRIVSSSFSILALLSASLLLAACTADLTYLPGNAMVENPSYLRKHIAEAPQFSNHELLLETLATEQIYVDMLADFALGRFDSGIIAGGGSLMEGVRYYLGAPYRWGGVSRKGIDCSGFTMQVYRRLGVRLPHNSAAQSRYGSAVPRTQLRAGDLVFFAVNGKSINHVGVMINKTFMAHCSSRRGRCAVERLSRTYPGSYAGARRLISPKKIAGS